METTNKKTKISQKDIWAFILEKHNEYTSPKYYNHVRYVVKIIEEDNGVKVPYEVMIKLDKKYRKLRDKGELN